MTMVPETIPDLEEILRGQGATLTPVEPHMEQLQDLATADGRFQVSPAQNMRRNEQAVTLYRTDTAEAIPTDTNIVKSRLVKTFPIKGENASMHPQLAGKFAFTLGVWNRLTAVYDPPEPMLKPRVGGELCWLNPMSPQFEYTRSLGIISVCRYKSPWSSIGLEDHITSKHLGVWPLIERDRETKRAQEEKDRLTFLIEAAIRKQGPDLAQAPKMAQAIIEAAETAPVPQARRRVKAKRVRTKARAQT